MIFIDILDEGQTWWQAFEQRRHLIYDNKSSMQTLASMQNFYESFCTSRNVRGEPDFRDDYIHQDAVPDEDNQDEILFEDDCNLPTTISDEDIMMNPFVSQLAEMRIGPTTLDITPWPRAISEHHAKRAVEDIGNQDSSSKCVSVSKNKFNLMYI